MNEFTKISEAQWQTQFTQLATTLGWHHMHVRHTRGRGDQWTTSTSVTGWPDLTLWHETQQRLIVVELKADRGTVRPEQRQVLLSLEAAGIPAYILRPRHLNEARGILRSASYAPELRATHLLAADTRSTR